MKTTDDGNLVKAAQPVAPSDALKESIAFDASEFEKNHPRALSRRPSSAYPWGWEYASHWAQKQFLAFHQRGATPPAQSSGQSLEAAILALQKTAAVLQQFKSAWCRVPAFANKANKATREAISLALGPIVNLDAVGGPLDAEMIAALASHPAPQASAQPAATDLSAAIMALPVPHGMGTYASGWKAGLGAAAALAATMPSHPTVPEGCA